MAKGAWDRTSAVIAAVVNVHRDPKKGRPARPSDFNPFTGSRSSKGIRLTADNIGTLKALVGKRRTSEGG